MDSTAKKTARMVRQTAALAIAAALSCRLFAMDEAGWRAAVRWSGAEPETVFTNGEAILVFTNTSQKTTLTFDGMLRARVLAVGGGGGGARQAATAGSGGGGGGGGVVVSDRWTFHPGEVVVSVGAGGAAKDGNSLGESGKPTTISTNGVDVFKAFGGGGGGRNNNDAGVGQSGGSGGGGGKSGGAATQDRDGLPKNGTRQHYGNAGGSCNGFSNTSGGGGGAGGPGGDASAAYVAGAGGDGVPCNITGQTLYYGAGGGGSSYNKDTYGLGGTSGDATGSYGNGGGDATAAQDGQNGFGGGGGGASAGSSGAGGGGVAILRLDAFAEGDGTVEKPSVTNFTYNGAVQSPISDSIIGFACMTGEVALAGVPATVFASDAGEYAFRLTRMDEFVWSDHSGAESIDIYWSIEKATNFVEASIANWKEGAAAKSPEYSCAFGMPVFDYAGRSEGVAAQDAEYTGEVPAAPGGYWMRALVADTCNYDGATNYFAFTILQTGVSPVAGLGWFADAAATGYDGAYGAPATNFPLLVKVAPGIPAGFSYDQVEADGSDIRFADDSGSLLASAVYTNASGAAQWNYGGTSWFVVNVPRLTDATAITMCWGAIEGAENSVPDAPGGVWGDYSAAHAAVSGQYSAGGWCDWGEAAQDAAVRAGNTLKNRWLELPELSKTEWTDEDAVAGKGATVVKYGRVANGAEITVAYRRHGMVDEEGDAAQPVVPGRYDAVFAAQAGDGYAAAQTNIVFDITGSTAHDDILETASGRILLMNNDTSGGPGGGAITCQAYANTSESDAAFWDILAPDEISKSEYPNLKNGTEFMLRKNGQTGCERLWHLVDCRHGNTFPATGTGTNGLSATGNFLPWSATSCRITSPNAGSGALVRNNYRKDVGVCLMRNSTNAVVVSSCFDEGIGTIYFDAVNSGTEWTTEGADNYALVVEIATNCWTNAVTEVITGTNFVTNVVAAVDDDGNPILDGDGNQTYIEEIATNILKDTTTARIDMPPTDANLYYEGYVAGNYVTNYYYPEIEWESVTLTPYKFGVGGLAKTNETAAPVLDVAQYREVITGSETNSVAFGGQTNMFYRFVAKLDVRVPARMRIRRKEVKTNAAADDAFILLDNIIVSHPAMRVDLETCGKFDEDRDGTQTLGWEGAWNTAFPSAAGGALYARARPVYSTNSLAAVVQPPTMVAAAQTFYRWRYLDQTTNDWKAVTLNQWAADGIYKAHAPLDVPKHEGDIEFYYVLELNAPYYQYHDFSGMGETNLLGFTENIAVVTNRRSSAALVPQTGLDGTDWFTRLRRGASDYEEVIVTAVLSDTADLALASRVQTNVFALAVNGDHTWRGYMKTPAATNEYYNAFTTVHYRLEARNRQTDGATQWATNTVYWKARDDVDTMPVSGTMVACGEDDWAVMPYSWETGHYLFQATDLDDALYLSVMQADYQNFNAWHDARMDGRKFLGNSIAGETNSTGRASGASSKTQEFRQNFAGWQTMSARDSEGHWRETFDANLDNDIGLGGPEYYKYFSTDKSPNGWGLLGGMAVFGQYRDRLTGLAFQMKGQGVGAVQFTDAATMPRGIDTFSFRARVATVPDFKNFAYFTPPGYASSFSNYTVTAMATLDYNSGKSFRGNGTVSLVAYYTPDTGCYEFRMEQYHNVYTNAQGKTKGNYANNGQVFYLYKWKYDAAGRMTSTQLSTADNRRHSSTDSSGNPDWMIQWPTARDGTHNAMFLSVATSNAATFVTAGIFKGVAGISTPAITAFGTDLNGTYCCLGYEDKRDRLTCGYPGVSIANCPGRIVSPVMLGGNVSPMKGQNNWKNGEAFTFPSSVYKYSLDLSQFGIVTPIEGVSVDLGAVLASESGNGFNVLPGLFRRDKDSKSVEALTPSNTVAVFVADVGTTNGWKQLATTNIVSFGVLGDKNEDAKYTFTPYRTPDSAIMVQTVGSDDDPRVDVVIDDLEITQWRGTDWSDAAELSGKVPGYQSEASGRDGHTNFVFTSCWITNSTVLMSAKRTDPDGSPCSIRSPLMDGYRAAGYTRGSGLGMFSFNYRNADANLKLELQVATNNVDYSNIANYDTRANNSSWETVHTWDFSTLPSSGTQSYYLGYHGVTGAVRIAISADTVAAAVSSPDPKFGEITITDVFCRDEPTLGLSDWWGWNLRTLGTGSNAASGDEDVPRAMLGDKSKYPANAGLSLALNNSTNANVYLPAGRVDDPTYAEHVPFVQTPLFSTNVVGEVSFRARKYDASGDQPALVTIYGSKNGAMDAPESWKWLASILVTNEYFTTYTFRADQTDGTYRAFRLAVIGVPGAATNELSGVTGLESAITNASGRTIYDYRKPVRVLIDEVSVSQTMRAVVGFRDVGAFRNQTFDAALQKTTAVTNNFPGRQWQPLIGEEFGIQAEVYAKQLPEEVDFGKGVRVFLHWYCGEEPWGFENWRDKAGSHRVELAPATDNPLVFRSSHQYASAAVIPDTCDNGRLPAPGTAVQYMLEVQWYPAQEGAAKMTSYLEKGDWPNPEWYAPVDRNAGKSADEFAAYTLLDSVAPGWAWINEVNIFGGYDGNWENQDAGYQYVEVATPVEADLTGWSVRLLDPSPGSDTVVTNTLATFGEPGTPATKTANSASGMVFRVVGGPLGESGGRLKRDDGTLDAVWPLPETGTAWYKIDAAELYASKAVALQLVRASGVVEHEIVAMGYDYMEQFGGMNENDTPQAIARWLNGINPGGRFAWVGNDWTGEDDGSTTNPENAAAMQRSLGVLSREADGIHTNNWSAEAKCTPGRINEGQTIDPDAIPRASGTSIMILAEVAGGHIEQSIEGADGAFTNSVQILYVAKGSERGTNITYRVDRWYELGDVTTNGAAAAAAAMPGAARYYTIAGVGLGASNNITVTASARACESVRNAGVLPGYEDAVMDWLAKGKTLRGDFANPSAETVSRARFLPYHRGADAAALWDDLPEMSLTEMYWLDMDPTMGGLVLRAGITAYKPNTTGSPYSPHSSETDAGDTMLEIYMNISNCTTDASSEYYGTNWTPYVMRGAESGVTSHDWAAGTWRWTNATFKVNGLLDNTFGRDLALPDGNEWWTGLRWFVFGEESFDENNKTTVYIVDPLSTASPGFRAGWRAWYLDEEKNPERKRPPVYMRWALDTTGPGYYDAEMLQKTNTTYWTGTEDDGE